LKITVVTIVRFFVIKWSNGSLGKDLEESGVQNEMVKNVTLAGSQNGLRIKSWGRPSNGFAKDILSQHIAMNNVQNPIVIYQNYCHENKDCPGQVTSVLNDLRITVIPLEDVKLTYRNGPADNCNAFYWISPFIIN
jgi:polygalacturonase